MYDVNVNKIEQIFAYTKGLIHDTNALYKEIKQAEAPNPVQLLAAQRVLHIYFEVFTDVTNLLIDGFVMRDPGGYEDMVDILDDETVISADTSHLLRQVVQFYRQSVKEYVDFELESTAPLFVQLYPKFHAFIDEVQAYLQQELQSTREL